MGFGQIPADGSSESCDSSGRFPLSPAGGALTCKSERVVDQSEGGVCRLIGLQLCAPSLYEPVCTNFNVFFTM